MFKLLQKIIILLFIIITPVFAFAEAGVASDVPLVQSRSVWENIKIDTSNYFYKPKYRKKIQIPKKTIEKFKKENFQTPDYSKVERIVIHDTGCCNKSYSDTKELIQRINKDHSIKRGWEDIGYNYIIDKNGDIYEGRKGGNGKRGAHAYDDKECRNFNVGTIGIVIIGDYEHRNVPKKALESLYKLVGWLSASNGISPKEINKTTLVWSNPKFQGECITKYGGSFSSSFLGPVVLGHKDVEPANSDPGLLNMNLLRKEAEKWKNKYENNIYSSEGEYFSIKDGLKERREISKNAVKLAKSQADLFLYKKTTLPDETLIKVSSDSKVFVVKNNKRKHITSYEVFKKMGYLFKNVKLVSEKELLEYELGDPIVDSAEKSKKEILIRKAGSPEVYVVQKNKARWIKTYEAFKQLGYSMGRVISLSKKEFSKYALGSVILAASDVNEPAIPEKKQETKITPAKKETSKTTSTNTQKILDEEKIRIAISELEKSEEVKVTANGEFNLIDKNGKRTKYNAKETANIKWSQMGDVKLSPLNPNTIFEVLSYTDYNWNKTVNFNKFRGVLEIAYSPKSKKVWLINELPFEEYLLGMAEAMDSDPKEYQKAFAVSARSYAMFHLERGGKRGSDEIFHLNNTPSDQVYRGYVWELYAPSLPVAVKETKGEVMKYNGKIARSVYSSDSGGVTKNACKFWGSFFCADEYKYLSGGVKDPAGTKRRDAEQIAKSHGVGMSAAGGRRLAELGKSYKEILKYYYKGIEVVNTL